jgi:cell division protein FtsB
MDILKKAYNYILSIFPKWQVIVIIVLLVLAFGLNDSNIFTRFGYDMEIRDLKNQIEYYHNKTQQDKRKLEELRSNKENIEKFARENYGMKKDNEDVFVIE